MSDSEYQAILRAYENAMNTSSQVIELEDITQNIVDYTITTTNEPFNYTITIESLSSEIIESREETLKELKIDLRNLGDSLIEIGVYWNDEHELSFKSLDETWMMYLDRINEDDYTLSYEGREIRRYLNEGYIIDSFDINQLRVIRIDENPVDNYIAYENILKELELKKQEEQKKVLPKIEEIGNTVNEIFGINGEFVEVGSNEFKPDSSIKYRITIYYPKINLQNSLGHTHTIYDFYINTYFKEDLSMWTTLYGNRGKRSIREFESHYFHSHASSCNSSHTMVWGNMCLGSSTPIVNAIADVRMNYSKTNLTKFLVCLAGYPYWESLEGTPYMKMINIVNRSSRRLYTVQDTDILDIFREFMQLEEIKGLIKNSNNLSINPGNPEFIKQVEDIITIKYPSDLVSKFMGLRIDGTFNDYNYLKNASGSSRNPEELTNSAKSINNNQKIYFKDKVITCEFYDDSRIETEIKQEDLMVNPEICRRLAEKINQELNEYLIDNFINEFRTSK